MGFLKKAGLAAATGGLSLAASGLTGGPKYNQDASALGKEYGVISDLGNMNIVKNADGTYSKKYTSSDIDNMRNELAKQGLSSVTLDPQTQEQAYYDRATRLLNDQYDKQLEATDERLINRGIQTGTKQYNDVMGNVQNNQLGALSDLANQAVFAGQDYTGSQISNINSLTGGRDINTLMGMGGSNGAYDRAYEAKQYQYNNRSNLLNNLLGTGASIGAAALLSDKRAKENLKKVGELDNGLKVYVGNYKKETGLDTRPQLFLLAQEVKKKKPEAVVDKGGILAVNYKKATEKR